MLPKVLIIDNYDSFTYNLYQEIGELLVEIAKSQELFPSKPIGELQKSIEGQIIVDRNDVIDMAQIDQLAPTHIILSPGPGWPKDAGICIELIKSYRGKIPILGVCLGHQAICEAYGSTIVHSKEKMHGKSSAIEIVGESMLFSGVLERTLPRAKMSKHHQSESSGKLKVARYHSLAVNQNTLPNDLKITAVSDDGEVMAVEDAKNQVYGAQFHPESILTSCGKKILQNFLFGNA